MHPNDNTVPFGFCECGCGERTKIARHTYRERGHIKGQPVRFIKGHWRKPGPLYIVSEETGCWEWQRARDPLGYGRLRANGGTVLAHRFVYEEQRGPIPENLSLDHLSRNPSCVNPDHLEPVTHAENLRRGREFRACHR
jgi:hypothetical protein